MYLSTICGIKFLIHTEYRNSPCLRDDNIGSNWITGWEWNLYG